MTDSDFDSLLAGGNQRMNAFTVSALHQESCMRDLGFTPSALSQRLNESLVLLLPLHASYSFDSQSNELVYLLPGPNTPGVLRRERAKRFWKDYVWEVATERVLPVAMGVVKTVFGCFLVLSLSVVVLALLALLFASSQSRGNGGSGGGGGMGGIIGGRGRFFSPFRFWYWPVGGGGGLGAAQVARRSTPTPTSEMSFVEAVFSFVFGDNHNDNGDEWVVDLKRFLVGKRDLRAFQFCAFLPSPPAMDQLDKEHAFMSLVLSRFQGHVSSTNGHVLVYNFPVASNEPKTTPAQMYRQLRQPFSLASPQQTKLCAGLGAANLAAVLLLAALSHNDEFVHRAMVRGGAVAGSALELAHYAFPALLAYALVFVLVPLARYAWLTRRNREIDEANQLRELWRRRAQDLLLAESA